MNNVYIGIDVGSVSLNIVAIDETEEVVDVYYSRTYGRIIDSVKDGIKRIAEKFGHVEFSGCGATGSARHLVAALTSADSTKNEITTHATAALKLDPDVRTVIEIGGEDSKIIILRNGIPVDFSMNTMCAAGTGAFLDQLASRLKIPVEDLGEMALASKQDVAISGRCTVFAESDMIFKQQVGHRLEDIVKGLCRSLVRNYLNDLAKGKKIESPVFFQGGVAANTGIRSAFEEAIGIPVTIPEYYNVMGSYGAALIAKRELARTCSPSRMKSPKDIAQSSFRTDSFTCDACANRCEIISFIDSDQPVGHLGGRCGRWETMIQKGGER